MGVNTDILNPTAPTTPVSPPTTPPETPPGNQTGAGATGEPQAPPSTPATGQGQQPGTPEGADPTDLHLSRADLDARVEKAKRSGVREMLSAMGFEDIDDPDKLKLAQTALGDLITFARAQQREQMTATEQVQADLKTAQELAIAEQGKRTIAEQERDSKDQNLINFMLRATIIEAAQGAEHPSDVFDYSKAYQGDLLAQVIKTDVPMFKEDGTFDSGAINQEAVKAIVDKCKEERSGWFSGSRFTPGSPSNAGARPSEGDLTKQDKGRELARANLTKI